jgi:hypothetical protein
MLLCEQCGEGVAVVDSEVGPEHWSGMPYILIAHRWPGLTWQVTIHDVNCDHD